MVVEFVATRFVISPVAALRSDEKNDVEVPSVAVKAVTLVVASVDVPVTENAPFDVDEPTVSEPVTVFTKTDDVAKRLVVVAFVKKALPACWLPIVRFCMNALVLVELLKNAFVEKRFVLDAFVLVALVAWVFVAVRLVAMRSVSVPDAATSFVMYAFVVVEFVSIASVSVDDAAINLLI